MALQAHLSAGEGRPADIYESSGHDFLITTNKSQCIRETLQESFGSSGFTLKAANLAVTAHLCAHWIYTDASDRGPELGRIKGVETVRHIYFGAGQGDESAAVPIFNTVNVLLNDLGQRSLSEFERLGLVPDLLASRLLHPYCIFLSVRRQSGVLERWRLLDDIRQIGGVKHCEFDWLKLRAFAGSFGTISTNECWNRDAIGLPEAHARTTGAEHISIGIIDSGFDLAHRALRFTPNSDDCPTHFNAAQAQAGSSGPYRATSDYPSHGTAVAGIAAARGEIADMPVIGVAPSCRIMPISMGAAPTANRLAAGLKWAIAKGCRIINMSFSTVETAVASEALKAAWNAGAVLCASAGNFSRGNKCPAIAFPAKSRFVISVGAADRQYAAKRPGRKKGDDWGSAFGAELDVIAPGVDIWTTNEKGTCGETLGRDGQVYAKTFGTSAAAPHVAGMAGLLWSLRPELTHAEVRRAIEMNCTKVHADHYEYCKCPPPMNGTRSDFTGHGLINVAAALRSVL